MIKNYQFCAIVLISLVTGGSHSAPATEAISPVEHREPLTVAIERLLVRGAVRETELPALPKPGRVDRSVTNGISCTGEWYPLEQEGFMISRTSCEDRSLAFGFFRIGTIKGKPKEKALILAAGFYDSDGDGVFERVPDLKDRPIPQWVRDRHRATQKERLAKHLDADKGGADTPKLESYLALAEELMNTGDLVLVKAVTSKALELSYEHFRLYELRSGVHLGEMKYEDSIRDASRAIELEPKTYLAYGLRGDAHRELGNYDAALADLNRSIELNKDFANSYRQRGFVYEKLGRRKEAIADFTRTIELAPDDC